MATIKTNISIKETLYFFVILYIFQLFFKLISFLALRNDAIFAILPKWDKLNQIINYLAIIKNHNLFASISFNSKPAIKQKLYNCILMLYNLCGGNLFTWILPIDLGVRDRDLGLVKFGAVSERFTLLVWPLVISNWKSEK